MMDKLQLTGQNMGRVFNSRSGCVYRILSTIVHNFYTENDAEIFSAHYIWKVTEKGFKMAFTMNKLAMMNYCEIILEK
jgi:hypothetical protein